MIFSQTLFTMNLRNGLFMILCSKIMNINDGESVGGDTLPLVS